MTWGVGGKAEVGGRESWREGWWKYKAGENLTNKTREVKERRQASW